MPSPGSFLGAGFTNGVTSKSSGRSRRLEFNAGRGASSSPGGHRRPGWPGPRSHPAPGRSTSLSPALSQPLPDVVAGGTGAPLLVMLQGAGAQGGIRDPQRRAAPSGPSASRLMTKPHVVKSAVRRLQADTLPGTCPRSAQQEGQHLLWGPLFRGARGSQRSLHFWGRGRVWRHECGSGPGRRGARMASARIPWSGVLPVGITGSLGRRDLSFRCESARSWSPRPFSREVMPSRCRAPAASLLSVTEPSRALRCFLQ